MKTKSFMLNDFSLHGLLFGLVMLLFTACDTNAQQMPAENGKNDRIIAMANEQEAAYRLKEENYEKAKEGKPMLKGNLVGIDGETLSFEDITADIIVLDFWAPYCAPCLKKIPEFYDIMDAYKDENVAFLLVSIDEDFDGWKAFAEERGWTAQSYWIGGESKQHPLYWYTFEAMQSDIDESIGVISALPKQVILLKKEGLTFKNYVPIPDSLEYYLNKWLINNR